MANKDGLEPNKPVDFETLQRVKRNQREAAKHAKAEPKGKARRGTARTKDVRTTGEHGVSDVLPSAAPEGTKGK